MLPKKKPCFTCNKLIIPVRLYGEERVDCCSVACHDAKMNKIYINALTPERWKGLKDVRDYLEERDRMERTSLDQFTWDNSNDSRWQ